MAERYRKFNTWLRETFGETVYKVGLYGGFTCPNRDGTLGRGGCAFCNPAGSEPYALDPTSSLAAQWDRGVRHLGRRHGARKFVAYFQDYTTTYREPARLEALWREALALPGCVGLALCTRPDCLDAPVLDRLQAVAADTLLWVEVGVQTVNDRTLRALNRCHDQARSEAALAELTRRGLRAVGHVVLGLPGETAADMAATARFLAGSGIWGAKIHNLHVVVDTPLAEEHAAGRYTPMTLAAYAGWVVDFLERLPPEMVIHRLCGEASPRLTVAPRWSCNKMRVRWAIEQELERRDTRQGRRYEEARGDAGELC